jgi:hypothetical protein
VPYFLPLKITKSPYVAPRVAESHQTGSSLVRLDARLLCCPAYLSVPHPEGEGHQRYPACQWPDA